jgi:glycosyltransferase A (GT-A) superfamily protein (DUF2064 family)
VSASFTIAIVAKPCVPGKVKTRLHPDFTFEQAAVLAETSLKRTLDAVRAVPNAQPLLFFDGDELPDWAWGFHLLRQPGGDLDERLAHLFDSVQGPLLLIGMDTPQVSSEQLERVVRDWSHSAWLGLAPDGGFWALGMREPDGSLIRGVQMSQEDTGQQQLKRVFDRFGSRLRLLEELEDFDNRESALRVANLIPDSTFSSLVHSYLTA